MTALPAVLAVALAIVLYLLASARARLRELHSRLEARDSEALGLRAALEQTRERITVAEAARARIEAELESARASDDKLQSTFAALSREALDANSRHLLELGEQILARAQDMSRAESDKRAQVLTELVRPVQDSLGKVDDKIANLEALACKQYWEAFAGSPEMAVLFLPSDGLLAAALEVDPMLHEDAFARRIVLATPATLLALLLTIAHVWKQESIAANAREIASEGRELHKRIGDLSRHLARLGRALDSAIKTYISAVASFDARVLPSARRFEELKAAAVAVEVEPLLDIETATRLPRAGEEEVTVKDDAN